ncbi:6833_t:CDS:2 [Ambispora gerdemannii]|uniref:6833_t:CDS:1 n=1 Tax=Ambispora gerdemannii TaxID=144530 RepID=A0A9N9D6N5_9GLOM|nr:6833_t:CDS:2 [Ambispora gerdemannii]
MELVEEQNNQFNPDKLEVLTVGNNSLSTNGLTAFSRFINLKTLEINNLEPKTTKRVIYNHFTGFNSISKSPQKLLNDLAQIKQVNRSDLKAFLTQDHTSFSVLSVSTKHIQSTNRISVTLSKNSTQSFYLDKPKIAQQQPISNLSKPKDDCLQDAQNCTYFQFFNSKEKKLYTRFKDKVEENFEGTEAHPLSPILINAPSTKTSPPAETAVPTFLNYGLMVASLYQEHGFQKNNKAYHFFKNLYDYETHPTLLIGKHKLDAATGQHLPRNQRVFRHYNYQTQATTYFYRANEQLVGQARKPFSDKKHFRLGTRSLNPLSLLNLASRATKKEAYQFKKPKKPAVQPDFQEFLITRLLLLCKSAEFVHLPLEQEKVPKEAGQCSDTIYTHFTTKPVLRFTFEPVQAPVVRQFIAKLDDYATEFDMEESQDFYSYPVSHDHQHQTTQQLDGLCGCEIRARNQYLDN